MKTRVCHACSSAGTENLLITNNIWENNDYPDNSTITTEVKLLILMTLSLSFGCLAENSFIF